MGIVPKLFLLLASFGAAGAWAASTELGSQVPRDFDVLLERLQAPPLKPDCGEAAGRTQSGDWLACSQASEKLCDPQVNAASKRWTDLQEHLQEIEREYESAPAVKSILQEKGAARCSDLTWPLSEFSRCRRARQEAMGKDLFNRDVRTRLEALFASAKKMMAASVRQSLLSQLSTVEKIPWEASLAEIQGLKLVLPDQRPALMHEGSGARGSEIFLGKEALLIDGAPDAVLYVMLHELAHRFNPNYVHSQAPVIKKLQTCLASRESIEAKSTDQPCLAALADRVQASEPRLAEKYRASSQAASSLESYEPLPIDGRWMPSCQNSQHDEVLPDFMAIEAFTSQRLQGLAPAEARQAALGLLAQQCYSVPPTAQRGRPQEPYFEHPLAQDRIDRLMVAHPSMRKALGCALVSESVQGPRYCGTR